MYPGLLSAINESNPLQSQRLKGTEWASWALDMTVRLIRRGQSLLSISEIVTVHPVNADGEPMAMDGDAKSRTTLAEEGEGITFVSIGQDIEGR